MYYFCIPCYNEARTVGVLLWKIRQVMEAYPRDYQILVVDDASTDATPEVLEPYARVLPLTVLRHETRRGYSASLERSLREAASRTPYPRRDAAVVLQADFTDEPEAIPSLLKGIESGADLVTSAVRWVDADEPLLARWTRRLADYVLRPFEWPEPITSPLSGFRAYRIFVLKKALETYGDRPLMEDDGWAANVGLLLNVIPYARRVDEVDVELRRDRRVRGSRFRPVRLLKDVAGLVRARSRDVPDVGEALNRGRKRGGRRSQNRGSDGGRVERAGSTARGRRRA